MSLKNSLEKKKQKYFENKNRISEIAFFQTYKKWEF